jgi:F0F1-type ATP synthase membrane subunit c/vacuolar-type H+-ATPase subunit K
MPSLQLFTTILTLVAFAGVIIGLAVEAAMQRAATSPGGVRAAGIVSAALGEAPALYGLVIFFVSGHRNWFFFGLSIVYFIGMWLRLPGMLRRMDELFPKS